MYTKEDLKEAFNAGYDYKQSEIDYSFGGILKPNFDQWHSNAFQDDVLNEMSVIGVNAGKTGSELAKAVMEITKTHNIVVIVDNKDSNILNTPKEIAESYKKLKIISTPIEPNKALFFPEQKGLHKKAFNGIKQPQKPIKVRKKKG